MKPNNDKENKFNRHLSFFEAKNIKDFIGNTVMTTGGVFILAGIYELVTKDSVAHLVEDYKEQIPEWVNWAIRRMDHMPIWLKTGGGLSIFLSGTSIKEQLEETIKEETKDEIQ